MSFPEICTQPLIPSGVTVARVGSFYLFSTQGDKIVVWGNRHGKMAQLFRQLYSRMGMQPSSMEMASTLVVQAREPEF